MKLICYHLVDNPLGGYGLCMRSANAYYLEKFNLSHIESLPNVVCLCDKHVIFWKRDSWIGPYMQNTPLTVDELSIIEIMES